MTVFLDPPGLRDADSRGRRELELCWFAVECGDVRNMDCGCVGLFFWLVVGLNRWLQFSLLRFVLLMGQVIVAFAKDVVKATSELARLDDQLPIHHFRFKERWGRATKTGELFPNYIFIGGGWRQVLFDIMNCFYIVRVVGDRDGPALLDDSAFAELREREDREGFVWLTDRTLSVKKGQRVKVATGPLQGHIGFVKGMEPRDRVSVMFRMFNRNMRVTLPTGELLVA